jgi:hypothetical protein
MYKLSLQDRQGKDTLLELSGWDMALLSLGFNLQSRVNQKFRTNARLRRLLNHTTSDNAVLSFRYEEVFSMLTCLSYVRAKRHSFYNEASNLRDRILIAIGEKDIYNSCNGRKEIQ